MPGKWNHHLTNVPNRATLPARVVRLYVDLCVDHCAAEVKYLEVNTSETRGGYQPKYVGDDAPDTVEFVCDVARAVGFLSSACAPASNPVSVDRRNQNRCAAPQIQAVRCSAPKTPDIRWRAEYAAPHSRRFWRIAKKRRQFLN